MLHEFCLLSPKLLSGCPPPFMGREERKADASVLPAYHVPLAGSRFSVRNGQTSPLRACVTRALRLISSRQGYSRFVFRSMVSLRYPILTLPLNPPY